MREEPKATPPASGCAVDPGFIIIHKLFFVQTFWTEIFADRNLFRDKFRGAAKKPPGEGAETSGVERDEMGRYAGHWRPVWSMV